MMISDEVKDAVMSDLLKDADLNHAELFINGLTIESKYKNVLLLMYTKPMPNKLVAFNLKISERQLYKLAEKARICAYNAWKLKLRTSKTCSLCSHR